MIAKVADNARQALSILLAPTLLAGFMFVQGCAKAPAEFASPQEAVDALVAAVRNEDVRKVESIMGSGGRDVIESGDDVDDQRRRKEFLRLYDEKHSITNGADAATLNVGKSDWPFPVPIVAKGDKWVFDLAEGKEEILNRRIGQNELFTIQVCKAVADAQHDYALRDPTNGGLHEYAQRVGSEPGKRNGLYWPTKEGEQPSPLGELVAEAAQEGYSIDPETESAHHAYHGYNYRLLKAQGPHAEAGAIDYVVKGKMILGFAVVAYPADYGNSGVMTFMINQDGVVYQKDLGEDTERIASKMTAFDPGEGWKKAE